MELNICNFDSSDNGSLWQSLLGHKMSLIQFLWHQLLEFQLRANYKELLTLDLIYQAIDNHIIATPRAYHKAHWMAKIIYRLKPVLVTVSSGCCCTEPQYSVQCFHSEAVLLSMVHMHVLNICSKNWSPVA